MHTGYCSTSCILYHVSHTILCHVYVTSKSSILTYVPCPVLSSVLPADPLSYTIHNPHSPNKTCPSSNYLLCDNANGPHPSLSLQDPLYRYNGYLSLSEFRELTLKRVQKYVGYFKVFTFLHTCTDE